MTCINMKNPNQEQNKREKKQLKAFHIHFKETEIGIEFIVWHFNRASNNNNTKKSRIQIFEAFEKLRRKWDIHRIEKISHVSASIPFFPFEIFIKTVNNNDIYFEIFMTCIAERLTLTFGLVFFLRYSRIAICLTLKTFVFIQNFLYLNSVWDDGKVDRFNKIDTKSKVLRI